MHRFAMRFHRDIIGFKELVQHFALKRHSICSITISEIFCSEIFGMLASSLLRMLPSLNITHANLS